MFYKNNKNGKIYEVIGECLNCTNAQDGQEMYIYKVEGSDLTFTRSKQEFHEKFTKVETSPREEITKDNYKTFKFDGVIAYRKRHGQPRDDGSFNGIGLIFEDAYRQDGSSCAEQGYGYRPSDTSWINSIAFNEDSDAFLPNGIYFNSTSRLNRELKFNEHNFLKRYECYKFKNVYEFARWVLELNGVE